MPIHLLNPLWDASGGSEWRTLMLFEQLGEHDEVALWTEYQPDPQLYGQYPIRQMLVTNTFPQGGTFVFVGAYWEIGRWLGYAQPDRVILAYNVIDPETLEYRINHIESVTGKKVELRFASPMIAEHANGREGTVEYSPIDFERFSPFGSSPHDRITIGRHSRDVGHKHHPNDPAIYRELIENGCRVRILGGTVLENIVDPDVELLPANSLPAEEFLRSLDIFFYQTDPAWTEAYGRVVAEAMGCGLPCVVESGGGYEPLIRSGENGLLFSSQEEAGDILRRLIADPELRAHIGGAARASVVALYEVERKKMIDYYLGSH